MSMWKEFDLPGDGPLFPPGFKDPIYNAVYDAWSHELVTGQEISDEVAVSFLRSTARGQVTATSFSLRDSDRQPIDAIIAPGKSGYISFTQSAAEFSRVVTRQAPRTASALVDISAEELKEVGFHPLFAPLYDAPLHVRVVHKLHFQNPESPEDIPYDARNALAEIFNRKLLRNRE